MCGLPTSEKYLIHSTLYNRRMELFLCIDHVKYLIPARETQVYFLKEKDCPESSLSGVLSLPPPPPSLSSLASLISSLVRDPPSPRSLPTPSPPPADGSLSSDSWSVSFRRWRSPDPVPPYGMELESELSPSNPACWSPDCSSRSLFHPTSGWVAMGKSELGGGCPGGADGFVSEESPSCTLLSVAA